MCKICFVEFILKQLSDDAKFVQYQHSLYVFRLNLGQTKNKNKGALFLGTEIEYYYYYKIHHSWYAKDLSVIKPINSSLHHH